MKEVKDIIIQIAFFVGGFFFLLTGVSLLFIHSYFTGLIILFGSLLLIPYSRDIIVKEFKWKITAQVKVLLIIAMVIITFVGYQGYEIPQREDIITPPEVQVKDTSIEVKEETKPAEPVVKKCVPNWDCSKWTKCNYKEQQKKICEDLNNCGVSYDKANIPINCYLKEEEAKEVAIELSYDDLMRKHKQYLDTIVRISGEVIQLIPAQDDSYNLLISTRQEDFSYEDYIWVSNIWGDVYLEEDKIEVWGKTQGLYSYDSPKGLQTVPIISTRATELKK